MQNKFSILTPSGFQKFDGIIRKVDLSILIKTRSGNTIRTSLNHIFVVNGREIKASTLKPTDYINEKDRVVSITLYKIEFLYDPVNVQNGNLYISNGLISHNCHFLGSTATLISGDKLSKMSSVPFVYVKDDHLSIIEYPEENRNYFISVDTSEGVGGDYSAFSVIDITKFPYKVVAKYKNNKISHLIYPNIIFDIAKKYNESYVLVEINSVGIQVAQILHDELEYENLLMVASQTKIGQHLSYHNKANYGIKTTKQVKRIGCQTLKTLIEEDKLLIFDEDIIMELTNFVETKGSYQADEGYHDDLVMTLVLFAWASQDTLFKDLTNINSRKEMFEQQMFEIEQNMLPIGFYNDGQTEDEVLANF